MPHRKRFLPWIALLVVWVVWGSTYLAIRIVVHEMPPLPRPRCASRPRD